MFNPPSNILYDYQYDISWYLLQLQPWNPAINDEDERGIPWTGWHGVTYWLITGSSQWPTMDDTSREWVVGSAAPIPCRTPGHASPAQRDAQRCVLFSRQVRWVIESRWTKKEVNQHTHRIHGAGILMLTWLRYIVILMVNVTIYSITYMDLMGKNLWYNLW